MPIRSRSGLPTAMESANPRKATPRAEPIMPAEFNGSTGSKNMVLSSSAMLARTLKAMPAVTSAITLMTKSRLLLNSA